MAMPRPNACVSRLLCMLVLAAKAQTRSTPCAVCSADHTLSRCFTPRLLPQFLALTDKRPGAPSTLPEFMDRYDAIRPFGGFVVASVVFDSSGHIARPKVGEAVMAYRAAPPRDCLLLTAALPCAVQPVDVKHDFI